MGSQHSSKYNILSYEEDSHIWNHMKMSKWWQFYILLYCPFNLIGFLMLLRILLKLGLWTKHPKKVISQAESVGWKSLSPRKGFKKQDQAAVAWMNGDEIDTAVTWAEMALISTGSLFSSCHSGSAGSRAFAPFSCGSSQMSSAQWWLSPAQAENIQIIHLVTADCRTFVSHTSIFIKTHLLDTHNE